MHGRVTVFAALWLSMLCLPGGLHGSSEDWPSRLRQLVQEQELTWALSIAEDQLAEHPDDLEARGWRARLLAWTHRWNESEIEYQAVLQSAPHDMDILVGLADLLTWQERRAEAIALLDQAAALDASRNDVQLRRGRLLHVLGRRAESGTAYARVLSLDGLFGRVRAESTVATNANATAENYGTRSEVNSGFYRRFGQAVSQWGAADHRRPSLVEFGSDGRPQTSNGMNYAVRTP